MMRRHSWSVAGRKRGTSDEVEQRTVKQSKRRSAPLEGRPVSRQPAACGSGATIRRLLPQCAEAVRNGLRRYAGLAREIRPGDPFSISLLHVVGYWIGPAPASTEAPPGSEVRVGTRGLLTLLAGRKSMKRRSASARPWWSKDLVGDARHGPGGVPRPIPRSRSHLGVTDCQHIPAGHEHLGAVPTKDWSVMAENSRARRRGPMITTAGTTRRTPRRCRENSATGGRRFGGHVSCMRRRRRSVSPTTGAPPAWGEVGSLLDRASLSRRV